MYSNVTVYCPVPLRLLVTNPGPIGLKLSSDKGPVSFLIIDHVEKPSGNSPVKADYTGFTVGREFVVGYGLDWGERFRNLPYVAKVEAGPVAGC